MEINAVSGLREIRLGGEQGLPALLIENAACTATVALQGAQLLSFNSRAGGELLWLSERAVYTAGKAIRGGIPLCFPWFGPHPHDTGKPAHGFARNRPWQLVAAEAHEAEHRLRFRLQDDADTRALWPHAFVAELEMRLGTEAELTLSVSNHDAAPFMFTFALHSYFPIDDIRHTRVEGLEKTAFIDQLRPQLPPQSEADAIRFTAETDRVYTGADGAYRIVDKACTEISTQNCHSAVIWNPWIEKTLRLGDMAPDAWQRLVCVECGNIGADQVTLAPGEIRQFSLTIRRDT